MKTRWTRDSRRQCRLCNWTGACLLNRIGSTESVSSDGRSWSRHSAAAVGPPKRRLAIVWRRRQRVSGAATATSAAVRRASRRSATWRQVGGASSWRKIRPRPPVRPTSSDGTDDRFEPSGRSAGWKRPLPANSSTSKACSSRAAQGRSAPTPQTAGAKGQAPAATSRARRTRWRNTERKTGRWAPCCERDIVEVNCGPPFGGRPKAWLSDLSGRRMEPPAVDATASRWRPTCGRFISRSAPGGRKWEVENNEITKESVIRFGRLQQPGQNAEQRGDDVDVLHVAKSRQARLADQAPDAEDDEQLSQHIDQFRVAKKVALSFVPICQYQPLIKKWSH